MLETPFAAALARILVRADHPKTVVSALSGGMDSVVLLHLLAGRRGVLPPGARLVAAHLNHGLRGAESDGDEDFCRGLAAGLGIDFAAQRADAARTAREERLGVEEAGRLLRHRFFHDLAGGAGAVVLTGHHADDQAETILMHLRRGAHRRGLSGMREYAVLPVPPGLGVRVGRPLLAFGREKLRAYAERNRLAWREDASNLSTAFLRNRIRHRIIPMLESVLPGFRARLLLKAAALAEAEEQWTSRGAALAESMSRREGGGRFFRLAPEAFEEPERLLYAFRHLVEGELGCPIPYGALLSRLAQLAESGRLGEALSLPGRLLVRRERDGLFFFFPDRENGEGEAEIILPDPPFDIVADGLAVRAEWLPTAGTPPEGDRRDPEVEWLNPAGIRWPLRLRPPRPGERFRPLGAPGSRKIQDILVDLKTPRRKRGLVRVLADHAGALWLWPHRLAQRARLDGAAGKALRVCIRELPGRNL